MQHWADRGRWKGGGRRPLVVTDPTLLTDLRDLVEPATRGDPTAPLLWTAKSLRNLAAGLRELGHRIGHNVVADLLRDLGYSLQANRKTREGTNHPDRNAQFGYINRKVKQALAAREPAISVDTRKKGMHPASTPGRRDLPLRIAQAATAALISRLAFQFQGSRSATLLAG
jgi:transposase